MIEVFKPEGGLWQLRDTETGETLSRGPFVERKTANRAARQEAERRHTVVEAEEPEEAPAPPPAAPKAAPKPRAKPASPPPPPIVVVDEPTAKPKGAAPLVLSSLARHQWLEDAAQWSLERIKASGGEPPEAVRVTVGWPLGGRKGHRIGECWHAEASRDAHREVFVSPALDDSGVVISTVLHELVHASLGPDAKHGPQFKKLALAVGLTGKMTATTAGDALKVDMAEFVKEHGEYPAKGLDPKASGRKVQTTRLIKVSCPHCGYIARTTRAWLDRSGAPICPEDNEPMEEG